jgi:transcriptional regulator with XRE-family HTH domain
MSNVLPAEALAREVRTRRLSIGIATVKELAERAGFTVKTGSSIENARQTAYRPQTLAQLDHALGWAQGSSQAVLDGGEPRELDVDEAAAAQRSGASGGASPSSMDEGVVALPASALDGLSVEERDEVRAAALAEGLKRAREIAAARRLEEASLPDFSAMAARTVRRRPAWEAAQAGSGAGEEAQE